MFSNEFAKLSLLKIEFTVMILSAEGARVSVKTHH